MGSHPAKPRPREAGFWLAAAGALALALLFKSALIARDAFPFNADEAVVGLMARHIQAGSWPTFFYGQAYMGSLDAALVAGGFSLAGPSVLVIRIVQTILYLGTILTTMLLARQMGFTVLVCALAGFLMAIPPVNVTLYTTVSLGGYGEALLLGNLILLATLLLQGRQAPPWAYLGWGLLAGFAWWVFGLTLVYSVPAGVMLVTSGLRGQSPPRAAVRAVAAAGGLLLGALPMVAWSARNGLAPLLRELLGSAIAGASPQGLIAATASHAVNLALFGPTVVFGLRPPWGVSPLGMPVTPIIAILWLAAIWIGLRRSSWPTEGLPGRNLLIGAALAIAAGFIVTPFGADPSGRYFLPLASPLAVILAAGVDGAVRRSGSRWPLAIAALVLGFNSWTSFQAAAGQSRMTTQFDSSTIYDHSYDDRLVEFLLEHGETAGYSTYWVAYPLAFMSGERLVYLPHLPYHSDFRYSSRDDRYAPYREIVGAAPRAAYVTAAQPWLDTYLRQALRSLGVGYEESVIGDFRVFHSLTELVRPVDLGLGPEAAP